MLFKNEKEFYDQYEMPLARCLTNVDRRGVLIDNDKLTTLRKDLHNAVEEECEKLSKVIGKRCVRDAVGCSKNGNEINLGSPIQVLNQLKTLGIKVRRDRHTGNETTGEAQLRIAFAETGHEFLKGVLAVRELNKIYGYTNTRLVDSTLYGSLSAAGTVSGRRSARKAFCGVGINLQTIPKHSTWGKRFRECIVARPGKVFLSVDQVSAEDWVVQGLIIDNGGSDRGYIELSTGADRHARLASDIFRKPISECGKDPKTGGDTTFRFMGKKTRHAGNYGMREDTYSLAFAKEGFSVSKKMCKFLLDEFHKIEPDIQEVFQRYVREQVEQNRALTTPFGRHRQFFGLRPGDNNYKIMCEAFSYIPQSVVGDNTGMALLYTERIAPGVVVLEIHDQLVLEIDNDTKSVREVGRLLNQAFERCISFPNGFTIQIPIEFQIGYDLLHLKTCQDFSETGLKTILSTLNPPARPPDGFTSGVDSAPSEQP